jgi:hypothetical protein
MLEKGYGGTLSEQSITSNSIRITISCVSPQKPVPWPVHHSEKEDHHRHHQPLFPKGRTFTIPPITSGRGPAGTAGTAKHTRPACLGWLFPAEADDSKKRNEASQSGRGSSSSCKLQATSASYHPSASGPSSTFLLRPNLYTVHLGRRKHVSLGPTTTEFHSRVSTWSTSDVRLSFFFSLSSLRSCSSLLQY